MRILFSILFFNLTVFSVFADDWCTMTESQRAKVQFGSDFTICKQSGWTLSGCDRYLRPFIPPKCEKERIGNYKICKTPSAKNNGLIDVMNELENKILLSIRESANTEYLDLRKEGDLTIYIMKKPVQYYFTINSKRNSICLDIVSLSSD